MDLYRIKRRFSKSSKFEPLVTEDLEDIELEEKRGPTYSVSKLHDFYSQILDGKT